VDSITQIVNGSLLTDIPEATRQFIGTDAGVANQVIVQQLHDLQVQGVIMITLVIIVIIELYQIHRTRRNK
jgi:hypothetical protein